MSKPFRLSLTVHLQTPLSSGAAGTSGPVLADKVVVRNGLGEYTLPGSQVRGVLRHACERLLRAMGMKICTAPRPEMMCPQWEDPDIPEVPDPFDPGRRVRCCTLCTVFGSPYFPSPLQFHDLTCVNPFHRDDNQPYANLQVARLGAGTVRPMISLSRYRRVVERQRLFFMETTPAQPGVVFLNSEAVVGNLENATQAKLLLAGLKTIVAMGGGRSRGFGWVEVEATAWLDERQIEPGGWEALREL